MTAKRLVYSVITVIASDRPSPPLDSVRGTRMRNRIAAVGEPDRGKLAKKANHAAGGTVVRLTVRRGVERHTQWSLR
jgi:hypothetical protein